jgi:hypothetical protein
MAKLASRVGESIGFHCYSSVADESTLGNPEALIWSSIRHLGSYGVAYYIAKDRHGLRTNRDRQSAANNIKLYIRQAADFYEAARLAKANTAPLIYYYSFLNLAKALCEFKMPQLHKRPESYRHGLSWRPSAQYLVDLQKEYVTVSRRGIWHLLWEALMGVRCPAANPTKLRIADLFAYCPEISVECEMVCPGPQNLITLEDPAVLYNPSIREAWIRFSLDPSDLKLAKISMRCLIQTLRMPRSGYQEVVPAKNGYRTFETEIPVKVGRKQYVLEAMESDISALNLFTAIEGGELKYAVSIQRHLPFAIPQISVLYTILFWLGSLVRYDPHSVADLMDSHNWTLIDGFMSQSCLWLLERMEWALYGTETTLRSAR